MKQLQLYLVDRKIKEGRIEGEEETMAKIESQQFWSLMNLRNEKLLAKSLK
jgi:hypothetical protein